MKIGSKILELRKKDNLTQEGLASKMKVTRQTISSWESELTSPDLEEAVRLAKIFKVSLDALVCEEITVECKVNKSNILYSLVGKEVYMDADTDDYRCTSLTPCKVLAVDESYIKFEFKDGKKTITKLMDINLIYSFKIIEKKETK